MWYIQTIEYYSAIKREKSSRTATTWVKLKNIILSERNHHQRPYLVWFHLYEMSKIGKTIVAESRLVVASARGRMEVTANDSSFFLGVIKMF